MNLDKKLNLKLKNEMDLISSWNYKNNAVYLGLINYDGAYKIFNKLKRKYKVYSYLTMKRYWLIIKEAK